MRRLGVAILTLFLVACGGGGSSPQAPPPAPPPPPNRSPFLASSVADATFIERHQVNFDFTQGGTTFLDPDGDALTYQVAVMPPLAGLDVVAGRITGIPVQSGSAQVVVNVMDSKGAISPSLALRLTVVGNAAPVVTARNLALLTTPGAHVDYELTQGGRTFTDPDGDPLTYEVRAIFPAQGLALSGVRVAGSLGTFGLATFEITASDGYGGTAVDEFRVAAVAPAPGAPSLPSTMYAYTNAALPLPFDFKSSGQNFAPFWDRTARQWLTQITDAGATLGRVLFYDKRVSITNTHSCGSCHVQANNFASPERFNAGVMGVPLSRNSMALANVRFNLMDRFFIDQRARALEDLIALPIEEPRELGNFLPMLVDKLQATSFYPALFEAAFGTPVVTEERIKLALVQFLQSLITFRSRFDQAYHGMDISDPDIPQVVFTPAEQRGAELFLNHFVSPMVCSGCHATGVQLLDSPTNNGLDVVSADPGNFEIFRAASLRNIAVSGPYMHDGRFGTLREVIEHYDHGIQDTPRLSVQLRVGDVGPVKRMNLTEPDKDALEAFLHTLTDNNFLTDPKFSNPFL
jgi:cytochrome c peroxidase